MLNLAPIISGTFLKIDGTVVITAAAVTVLAVPRNIWIWALYIVLPGSAFIHTTGSYFYYCLDARDTHTQLLLRERESGVRDKMLFLSLQSL